MFKSVFNNDKYLEILESKLLKHEIYKTANIIKQKLIFKFLKQEKCFINFKRAYKLQKLSILTVLPLDKIREHSRFKKRRII